MILIAVGIDIRVVKYQLNVNIKAALKFIKFLSLTIRSNQLQLKH